MHEHYNVLEITMIEDQLVVAVVVHLELVRYTHDFSFGGHGDHFYNAMPDNL